MSLGNSRATSRCKGSDNTIQTFSQSCGSIYPSVLGSFLHKFSLYTRKDNHYQHKSVFGLIIQMEERSLLVPTHQGRLLLAVLGHKPTPGPITGPVC